MSFSFIKIKLLSVFIMASIMLPLNLVSQIIYTESNSDPQTLNLKSYLITEKTYRPIVVGSNYVYDEWQLADIILSIDSGVINNVFVKIDVLNNLIEVKTANGEKVLPANLTKILKLKEKNEIFITRNALGDYILNGYSKILYNGKASLLCNYSARIKEAKYNEALGVGNRDDELIIVKKLYLFINNNLIIIDKNKKRFIKIFDYNPKIQKFIEDEKISPKNEDDLIKLLTYIDTIV